MEAFHALVFVFTILVTLLVGIPAALYCLTKYANVLFQLSTKPLAFLVCITFGVLSYFLGGYITPAFYIFMVIFALLGLVCVGAHVKKAWRISEATFNKYFFIRRPNRKK